MSNEVVSLEVRIITNDGEVLVKAFNADDRQDWGWMLLPFLNALNGAGFVVDPLNIFKRCPVMGCDTDAVSLAVDVPGKGGLFSE